MKNAVMYRRIKGKRASITALTLILFAALQWLPVSRVQASNDTIAAGSFVINMGIVPQTVANGLKPYGMIYDLITNYGVPIVWVINPAKGKDSIDFSHNGIDYRGGPFIVPAIYRTAAVNARITYWQGQGVVGATTNSPIVVPVFQKLTVSSAPKWTLDHDNGSIAVGFFTNAGIPSTAYGGSSSTYWKVPADLNACDDIFVMPHADPTWAVHGNLLYWNAVHKGAIWTGCHSGSATELMFNPANPSQQTNFLSLKTGNALGSGPYASPNNSLIIWGSHDNGTPPYSYTNHGDPVMQFMGTIDAAVLNGSEQIYIPVQLPGAGWRPTTVVGVYDDSHPQVTLGISDPKYRGAIIAYGHAFGIDTLGYVMYEASHSINKALLPSNIAAQRAFFNFSLIAAKQKAPDPQVTIDLSNVYGGTANPLSFALSGDRDTSEFMPPNGTILWESSCGGTFSQATNVTSTVFTTPVISSPTNCVITITLTDACGRIYKSTAAFTIKCELSITPTVTNPCYDDPTGGQITMAITHGTAPYAWSWTKVGGGSGSGTGTTITGLIAGTYTVTVTDNGGLGCPGSFSVTLVQGTQVVPVANAVHITCPGGSNGAVNTSVSGGIPGYTYSWTKTGDPGFSSSAQNLSNLTGGTYNLTVTDSKGCIGTATATVNEPAAIVITPSITPVTCFGFNNGIINLSVSGGTGGYSYLWNDGNAAQNRTGLSPGTYSVTVTDGNGCTQTASGLSITQPAAALTLSQTHVNILCNGGSTGSIDLTVSGGTQFDLPADPYTYAWTRVGGGYSASTEDISGLTAGTYTVTVTDKNSCTANLSVTITQPAALTVSTNVTQPTCPPSADPPVNADGAITLTVSGGAGSYTFDWTDIGLPNVFTDPQNRSGLQAGTYTVVVKDANNCTATTTLTLTFLNPNPVQPSSINH
ncbi:MAG TPA: hypothetical protein P5228_02055 [Bacteroidales bacterium]|nr:hypothetical protein [Bacteroidales bacterium]